MLHQSLAVKALSLSLAYTQVPALAQSEPPASRDTDAPHVELVRAAVSLKHGELSKPVEAYTVREPVYSERYETIYLNSSLIGANAAANHAIQLSSVIKDSLSVFFTEPPTDQSHNITRDTEMVIRMLANHLQRQSISGTEVHLITEGSGSLLALAALNLADREITANYPLDRRELMKRLHVTLLGSPGPLINAADGREVSAIDQFSADLGSRFVIQRVNPDGTPIDDWDAASKTFTEQIIPALEPEMLRKNGELKIVTKPEQPGEFTSIIEIARAREVVKLISEKLDRAWFEQAALEITRAAGPAERAMLTAKIQNTLSELRNLEYRLNDVEIDQDKIAKSMQQIAQVLHESKKLVEELQVSNAENRAAVKRISETLRRVQTMLIAYALEQERPGVNAEIKVVAKPPAPENANNTDEGDFDGDGVKNKIESVLLSDHEPVLMLNHSQSRVPVPMSDYLAHAAPPGHCIDLVQKDWEANPAKSLWYARACKPDNLQRYGLDSAGVQAAEVYLLQYYALFAYNDCCRAVGLTWLTHGADILFTFLGGIADVEIQPLNNGEAESTLGNHEGDVVCVDLVVTRDTQGRSKVLFMVLHNHGRQIAVEADGIDFDASGRPRVYAENGTQELHPNRACGGHRGFLPTAGINKHHTGVIDEDKVTHDHWGERSMPNLPIWNVGELLSNSDGEVITTEGGKTKLIDTRVFEPGSLEHTRQKDARFFMEYPGALGNSNYRLYASVGIPFTPIRKKVADERFDSPKGPAFNSADGDSLKEGKVRGKMWARNFIVDGISPHGPGPVATPFKETRGPQGTTLTWDPVPEAEGYVIEITAPDLARELQMPGYTGEIRIHGMGHFTTFVHNEETGWQSGVNYTYTVKVVTKSNTRPMNRE